MRAALALPAPARDVLEPNDGISFVNGSVFARPDPYVWRGSGRRALRGSADRVEDPVDVYRVRLPRRSQARIRLRPSFGNPDLYVFRGSATSLDDRRHIIARSRKGARRTDAVTIRNPGRTARRFYIAIDVGASGGGLNASYDLRFQRTKFR